MTSENIFGDVNVGEVMIVGREVNDDDLIEAITDSAVELGVDLESESTVLNDAIDTDALERLVSVNTPDSGIVVSFSIWDVHFEITTLTVIAFSTSKSLHNR